MNQFKSGAHCKFNKFFLRLQVMQFREQLKKNELPVK
jgi:hypothetical protein